ncbi:disease resistance protein RGA2-like isoform X2 [Mangifera indica]|uniref:disease resistance protein RGA2-like isoform X2 n=1 Tax=Mangifera indica TaxID=29780 RepID=UPI001CF9EAD4|nr:disease resistance protein RGA2-like isoform X2 [Mangifera indica]
MAEGILSSVAGKILEGLGSLLLQEGKLAWGVKDEIQKLNETVNTIKSTLLDAEEQHNKMNQQLTNWIQRLKDAFYDADDLLDDFSTELRRREVMTGNKLAYETLFGHVQDSIISKSMNDSPQGQNHATMQL